MNERKTKYWMNVVSHNHVNIGKDCGIIQSCHGKAGPLKRMCQGDWVIHYSPKEEFQGKEPCMKFTSIGQIKDDEIYQFDMGEGFIPWRRKVDYLESEDIPISNYLEVLSFTKGRKSWGFMFRFGFFEIEENDFKHIYEAMVGMPFKKNGVHPFLSSSQC